MLEKKIIDATIPATVACAGEATVSSVVRFIETGRSDMKTFASVFVAALMCCFFAGCDQYDNSATKTAGKNTSSTTTAAKTKVSLESDLCAKCGCCAGCEVCCKGKKCDDCGMQRGTELCCTGAKPAEGGVYCKKCGFVKETDECCAESNVACDKCGLAKGSPICCKFNAYEPDDPTD